MTIEKNIKVLSGITQTLIDSCKGIQMCEVVASQSQFLQAELKNRQTDRTFLVNEFQEKIANYGGKYEECSNASAPIHKSYIEFINTYEKNQKAAIDLLNTGEAHLAEHIESKLDEEGLTEGSIRLLRRAHAKTVTCEQFSYYLNG